MLEYRFMRVGSLCRCSKSTGRASPYYLFKILSFCMCFIKNLQCASINSIQKIYSSTSISLVASKGSVVITTRYELSFQTFIFSLTDFTFSATSVCDDWHSLDCRCGVRVNLYAVRVCPFTFRPFLEDS